MKATNTFFRFVIYFYFLILYVEYQTPYCREIQSKAIRYLQNLEYLLVGTGHYENWLRGLRREHLSPPTMNYYCQFIAFEVRIILTNLNNLKAFTEQSNRSCVLYCVEFCKTPIWLLCEISAEALKIQSFFRNLLGVIRWCFQFFYFSFCQFDMVWWPPSFC